MAVVNERTDLSLRAMTNDGSLRVIVVDVTDTAREVARLQGADTGASRWLGELIAGTVMIRATMSPDLRVQGILQAEHGAYVADSHPDGGVRALFQRRSRPRGAREVTRLQMMRTLPRGSVQQGIVEVDDEYGVSGALMRYLSQSEQVESALAVATEVRDGEIVAAGGYLVQLLPELDEATLALMTARLQDFPPMRSLLAEGVGADAVLSMLLEAMAFTPLARDAVRFQCRCSRERVVASILSAGAEEVASIIRAGEPLEITCDYCTAPFCIEVSELASASH